MLLPREQNPWNCSYVLGAVALRALEEAGNGCDLLQLQAKMAEDIGKPLSVVQVSAAAAWLYLLDVVTVDQEGSVHLVSK